MTPTDRLRRLSTVMRHLCTLAMIAIPALLATFWLVFGGCWPFQGAGADPGMVGCTAHVDGGLARHLALFWPLPAWKQLGAFGISMLPAAAVLFGLWQLRRLFTLYGDGRIFTAANTRAFRRFASAVFVYALLRPLSQTALIAFLTFDGPPGSGRLAIQLGSPELTTFFLGGLFLLIAWVMDRGREIAEDQAQFV
ncbi:MAG: DUF2975 domain-containing protein [Alphaproteobacteria bacterium]|nr:DUF2975 domain-containing protein [Alphaproteobacteria bacterium]